MSGRVRVLCWYATPVTNTQLKALAIKSLKVKFGMKVKHLVKRLIGREVTVIGRATECQLTFREGGFILSGKIPVSTIKLELKTYNFLKGDWTNDLINQQSYTFNQFKPHFKSGFIYKKQLLHHMINSWKSMGSLRLDYEMIVPGLGTITSCSTQLVPRRVVTSVTKRRR